MDYGLRATEWAVSGLRREVYCLNIEMKSYLPLMLVTFAVAQAALRSIYP